MVHKIIHYFIWNIIYNFQLLYYVIRKYINISAMMVDTIELDVSGKQQNFFTSLTLSSVEAYGRFFLLTHQASPTRLLSYIDQVNNRKYKIIYVEFSIISVLSFLEHKRCRLK